MTLLLSICSSPLQQRTVRNAITCYTNARDVLEMVSVRWYKKGPLNPMTTICFIADATSQATRRCCCAVLSDVAQNDMTKKLQNCGHRSSWRLPRLQRSTNAELTIYLFARPIGYSKQNLKIHTGVTCLPSLPSPPFLYPPSLRSRAP